MKPTTLIRKAGSGIKLAAVLGVTRQAVTQAKRIGKTPKTWVPKLRLLRPEWFKRPAP